MRLGSGPGTSQAPGASLGQILGQGFSAGCHGPLSRAAVMGQYAGAPPQPHARDWERRAVCGHNGRVLALAGLAKANARREAPAVATRMIGEKLTCTE
jgi:hypothetical protein